MVPLNDAVLFVTAFVSVFSILNPIGAVPTLMALTGNYTRKERRMVVRRSILIAGGMIIGFMLVGIYVFDVLGIDIADFEVAGGVLLFKVALDMLQGKVSRTKLTSEETEESMEKESIGVVPIGTPLLAGPGTITTAIIYFNSPSIDIAGRLIVLFAVILVIVTAFIVLRLSTVFFDRLGKTGSLIISRIMGLLLAAIAVSFISSGIISIYRSALL